MKRTIAAAALLALSLPVAAAEWVEGSVIGVNPDNSISMKVQAYIR